MGALITPEQIPHWIPGVVTQDSSTLAWRGITLKGYRYSDMVVSIPPMRDYMLVSYQQAQPAQMRRRDAGPWQASEVHQGKISILTREHASEWGWSAPIHVRHVYLTHDTLTKVATEVFDRNVRDIEMFDVVSIDDAAISSLVATLSSELYTGGLGGTLYVDALRNQLCIQLLRRYARVVTNDRENCYGKLSPTQQRLLNEFIETNIGQNISLDQMASLLKQSVHSFIRKFQTTFSTTPHAYVVTQRIILSKSLLRKSSLPLKVVAVNCGFSDQSHMTRVFRKELNITPAEYRSQGE